MSKSLNTEMQRFKMLRRELNLTQQAFAERLGIRNSTADIERGKTRISGEVVAALLEQFGINPLWLFGKSEQKYLRPAEHSVLPKVVTLNSSENENIVLVNIKASAGYAHNLQDPEWYESLPAFDLPLPEYRNASYRGFQVEGNSMYPVLHSGEWVIARAEEKITDVKENQIYVVVLPDTVVVKKIIISGEKIRLISVNPEYPVIETGIGEVKEIWKVVSKISGQFDIPQNNFGTWAEEIRSELKEIRERLL
ncbi:helix-turn-helix domain-containing protein [Sinomicrobium pectinilyticum]|uniref:Helix-turn-helix domain-containing protein n=1 Tax=Sinomicrobium pectinilyticum TaxID=1084421 RepID=A0A3N0DR30_SINP1|nr:LexA family transcriptional regulator [Sinomicrobium pectinilyticum]RNL78072.1 helix-turn-helix domain-containing protein [Sinomicrobium pectinilyticum]